VGTFIIPIIIPLSLLQNGESSAGIAALLTKPTNSLYVTLGAVAFLLFTAVINVTASTSFSREGKGFWLSRAIPVPPGRQVYAKFLLSMAVAAAAMLLAAVLLLLVLKFSAGQTLLVLVLGLLGAAPINVVNMLPDLFHPKLLWTNPYEAVKQNMNVLLAMVLAVVLIGVDVAFTLILAAFRLNEWGIYLALAALQIVLTIVGLRVLEAASQRYYKIEA
jgi:ABC-2 type transport system permease protein